MKVVIKSFDVGMEVKTKGIEFDIYTPNGEERLGDCIISSSGITWCKGRIVRENGVKVSWKDFIAWMGSEEE